MIVNSTEKGWEIIFQRAHELLAVQIGWHWQLKQRPQRWLETLTAIGDHDNQQDAWQRAEHLTKAGAPIDFSQKVFSLQQAQNVVRVAQYKSRYVALLISMHVSYLYESLRGENKGLDQLLDEQKKHQQEWRKTLKISKQEAEAAYRLMHWCDRCSLILCRRQLPEDERRLEVFQGPDGETYHIWQRSQDRSLVIEPWPFEEKEFDVWVEVRQLEQLSFDNDEALAKALMSAKPVEQHWIFKK
ncbi:hypothetical protein D770_15360 [Flammeovirgaceae bacterium 311]|nr:hypothetical protein D770_15360 [Flammeovirgaceae bacterium 311]